MLRSARPACSSGSGHRLSRQSGRRETDHTRHPPVQVLSARRSIQSHHESVLRGAGECDTAVRSNCSCCRIECRLRLNYYRWPRVPHYAGSVRHIREPAEWTTMEWVPPKPRMQGGGVALRPFRASDAAAVASACRDPDILRFTFMKDGVDPPLRAHLIKPLRLIRTRPGNGSPAASGSSGGCRSLRCSRRAPSAGDPVSARSWRRRSSAVPA